MIRNKIKEYICGIDFSLLSPFFLPQTKSLCNFCSADELLTPNKNPSIWWFCLDSGLTGKSLQQEDLMHSAGGVLWNVGRDEMGQRACVIEVSKLLVSKILIKSQKQRLERY